MVETTAWEGKRNNTTKTEGNNDANSASLYQWSTSWQDADTAR